MKKQTVGPENKGNSSIYMYLLLDEPDDILFFFFCREFEYI